MNSKVTISPEFKKNTIGAILSILLFIIVYISLLTLSVILTLFCGYIGYSIMTISFHLKTLLFGIAVIGIGILIFIFLVKFFFKKKTIDNSNLIEITQEEEPDLFLFINDIVKEVKTKFPKKIYVSEDVNASVFYDSTFWSMFLPVRKNLQIGLGLVNTVSQTELKAILAHEFGHFSQKSMKIGSYVYNVNHIIYNTIYEDTSYNNFIQKFASFSNVTYLAASIVIKFINGIQWILQKMYTLVNKNHLKLSREMEFHADEVAANVTGYIPLKTSLLRLNLSDSSYRAVIDFYSNKIHECIKSKNIFKEQKYIMNFLAKENNIEIKEDIPCVTIEHLNRYNKSKLNFDSQWSSHPNIEDRIAALEKTNIIKEPDNLLPANKLFSNIENLQSKLTDIVFSNVQYSGKVTEYSLEEFISSYMSDFKKNSFDPIYNGYYNSKNPIKFEEEYNKTVFEGNIKDLFTPEKVENIYISQALESDIDLLKQIENENYKIKSFDYDGVKYTLKDVKNLINRLEEKLQDYNLKIEENDKNIFSGFYQLAKKRNNDQMFIDIYALFKKSENQYNAQREYIDNFIKKTEFIQYENSVDIIIKKLNELYHAEIEFKKNLTIIINDNYYNSILSEKTKKIWDEYLSNEYTYFYKEELKYYDYALNSLFNSINEYSDFIIKILILRKKDLLEFQKNLLEKNS